MWLPHFGPVPKCMSSVAGPKTVGWVAHHSGPYRIQLNVALTRQQMHVICHEYRLLPRCMMWTAYPEGQSRRRRGMTKLAAKVGCSLYRSGTGGYRKSPRFVVCFYFDPKYLPLLIRALNRVYGFVLLPPLGQRYSITARLQGGFNEAERIWFRVQRDGSRQ